jgi:uncharacterized damage-inducible protein DinB
MRLVEGMIEELNRTWNGEAWYGPSLRPLLEGITEERAKAHPIPNAHSILEVVIHSAFWMATTVRQLDGFAGPIPPEQDWRNVRTTSWTEAIAELERGYAALLDRVARMSDEEMKRMLANRKYTAYTLLRGITEHNIYHAGQLAMLKKA